MAYSDKAVVDDILSQAFRDNKNVNYIVKQDQKKAKRLRLLMEYSFDVCSANGEVFLSDDQKGCALVLFPDKKKQDLQSVLLDLKLVFKTIGLFNLRKAIKRESQIKRLYPEEPMYYLWLIGVRPDLQNNATGRSLLQGIIQESERCHRPLCLEISVEANVQWYC